MQKKKKDEMLFKFICKIKFQNFERSFVAALCSLGPYLLWVQYIFNMDEVNYTLCSVKNMLKY